MDRVFEGFVKFMPYVTFLVGMSTFGTTSRAMFGVTLVLLAYRFYKYGFKIG